MAAIVKRQAFELVKGDPGGFQVLGDPEADLFELMGQIVPRIRRLLARQLLKTDTHMPGLHIAHLMVRGRITWDDNEPAPYARDRWKGDLLELVRADGNGLRGLAV